MTYTQWFNPQKKEFPVHIGVYQRKWNDGISYSFWTGWGWSYAAMTIDEAIINRHDYSNQQSALWRGLAN